MSWVVLTLLFAVGSPLIAAAEADLLKLEAKDRMIVKITLRLLTLGNLLVLVLALICLWIASV